ncbi:MAG: hypothetical protein K7J46_03335 [Bryobacter sp.]|jgi:hypothetical protein|nr:hypothetical protein [Bryobacter sp. CoA8 C33]
MTPLLWLHPDCLSLSSPAWVRYPGAPALFVFDEAEIEAEQWTLKRIAFLYETLLELPCEIERGSVVERLLARRPARIVTVGSVNPRFRDAVRQLERAVPVEVLPAVPFVDYRGTLDLKRFARYWKRVEPILFDS